MRSGLFALMLWGCLHRPGQDEEIAFHAALSEADRAWESRARTGLDAIGRALDSAPASRQQHAELRWRRARWLVARALVAGPEVVGRRLLAEARDEALSCLQDDASVRAALEREGWVAALDRVGLSRMPCVEWASIAWARWLDAFGTEPGGVDVEVVRLLLGALAVSGDGDVASWMEALIDAGAPATRERGVAGLEDAYRRGRPGEDLWVRWDDLTRHDGTGTAPTQQPATPEERAAADRIGEREE